MYRAFLPGLSLWRGTEAYLSSNLAGQVLPPPGPSVVQYGYFRGGGYAPDAAGLAALGSFLFPTAGRLLLPVAALALLLVTGEVDGTILLAAGISLLVTTVSGIAGYSLLRGERSARWLGAKLQRPLSWILVKVKRHPIQDGAARAAQLRTDTLAVLREGWALGSIGVAANLAGEFAASVEHFASYANLTDPFYPPERARRTYAEEVKRTNDVVLRLEEQGAVVPTDAPGRLTEAGGAPGVVAVDADLLACDYVDRELLVQRTTSPAEWEDGRLNRGGVRLDVVLADAADRTPVVGELKLPGDMDPFSR
jgi:hypothetical protein